MYLHKLILKIYYVLSLYAIKTCRYHKLLFQRNKATVTYFRVVPTDTNFLTWLYFAIWHIKFSYLISFIYLLLESSKSHFVEFLANLIIWNKNIPSLNLDHIELFQLNIGMLKLK